MSVDTAIVHPAPPIREPRPAGLARVRAPRLAGRRDPRRRPGRSHRPLPRRPPIPAGPAAAHHRRRLHRHRRHLAGRRQHRRAHPDHPVRGDRGLLARHADRRRGPRRPRRPGPLVTPRRCGPPHGGARVRCRDLPGGTEPPGAGVRAGTGGLWALGALLHAYAVRAVLPLVVAILAGATWFGWQILPSSESGLAVRGRPRDVAVAAVAVAALHGRWAPELAAPWRELGARIPPGRSVRRRTALRRR